MPVKISYIRGGSEGESVFLGDAKISPEADAVGVVASQGTWDLLVECLGDTQIRRLSLDSVNEKNVDQDGSRILLKGEDGSTALAEYVFKEPLSFQAFHLLVTNSHTTKEVHRLSKSADKQSGWKWSGNIKK
jgi:hypothetical protein